MRTAGTVLAAVVAVLLNATAHAGPVMERPAHERIDLSEHIGKTFLQTLLTPVVGIDAEIDAEIYEPVTLLDGGQMVTLIKTFDPNVAKVFDGYAAGESGFLQAIAAIPAGPVIPGQLREVLRPITAPLASGNPGAVNGSTSGLALLTSGSGTLVVMDDKNYFYNVGYQDDNITTGRSYAVSGPRLLLDATHKEYLVDLEAYLKAEDDGAFYDVLLSTLTATDLRELAGLSPKGQAVMADFLAVYVAELERHEMAGLGTRAPWGVDLAEVTLLGGYVAASHMGMREGKFVSAGSEVWAAAGSIGNVKSEFTRLGKLITAYLLDPFRSPQLVDRVIDLTPLPDSEISRDVDNDVFRRVLVYLNTRSVQEEAQENAGEIAEAVTNLLAKVSEDHLAITDFIKACMKEPESSFACRAAKPPQVANILIEPTGALKLMN